MVESHGYDASSQVAAALADVVAAVETSGLDNGKKTYDSQMQAVDDNLSSYKTSIQASGMAHKQNKVFICFVDVTSSVVAVRAQEALLLFCFVVILFRSLGRPVIESNLIESNLI